MGPGTNTSSSSVSLVTLSFNNTDTLREARNRIEVERRKAEERNKPRRLSFDTELVFHQCFADISQREDFIMLRTKHKESSTISRSLLRFSSCFLNEILSDIHQDSPEIIIYLPDVEKKILDKMVDLIKTGETKISGKAEMDQIISAAEILGFDILDSLELPSHSQNTTTIQGEYFEEEENIKLEIPEVPEEDQSERICTEDEKINNYSLFMEIKEEKKSGYGLINIRNDLKPDYCPMNLPQLSSPPPPSPSPSPPPPRSIYKASRQKLKPFNLDSRIENLEQDPILALKEMKENTKRVQIVETQYKENTNTVDSLHPSKYNIPKKRFLIQFEKEEKTPGSPCKAGIFEPEQEFVEERAKSQPSEIYREKSHGRHSRGFETRRTRRNSGEKYSIEEERNISRTVRYLDIQSESKAAPVSSLPELRYIYDYSIHRQCGRRHRRIDTCPARLEPCCGRAHSQFMDCSGSWRSLKYMEDIALRWPTTTRRRQDIQRDIERRKRRPEPEYETERQYKRHKDREY